ncbi:MAG: fluoride efflux transporter CrcB [Hyphomicrobiales bacterium]|nr:fluoride efflux transporter CrcB [Hyphomicrobiales bacterium]
MLKVIIVGFGGFLGSILRYLIYLFSNNILGSQYPFSTIIINVLGCFLIGVIFQVFNEAITISENLKLFLTIGFLGGFTTFSTFSIDAFLIYQNNSKLVAMCYILLTLFLSLSAMLIGMMTFKS